MQLVAPADANKIDDVKTVLETNVLGTVRTLSINHI